MQGDAANHAIAGWLHFALKTGLLEDDLISNQFYIKFIGVVSKE